MGEIFLSRISMNSTTRFAHRGIMTMFEFFPVLMRQGFLWSSKKSRQNNFYQAFKSFYSLVLRYYNSLDLARISWSISLLPEGSQLRGQP